MKKEIESGRYSPYVVAGKLINYYAYVDFLTYEKRLEDKNMRKYVPAFDPQEIEKLCGCSQKVVDLEEVQNEFI